MKNHNYNFLNYFSFLIKVFIITFISLFSIAEENQIGLVSEINGIALVINADLEEKDLNLYDPIFSNEEIFTTENSSLTLQFKDDTTIIMKELTSFAVSNFDNSKLNPKFKSKVSKGKIIIETGSIAKNKSGEMEVMIQTSSLGLRGTRLNAILNQKGELDVSLGEDNFGNTGLIEIISNGTKQSIYSVDQVIEISDDKINKREKSTKEQNEEKLSNEIFVNNSKINEENIEIQLVTKLASGKIRDINNDGKIDTLDVEELKNQILNGKQQKIEFIIDNSNKENTEFLSSVINGSDEKNTGKVLEKVIDTKDDLVEDVVEDLSDKNNEFLTTSNSKGGALIKEKIFKTIVENETDKSSIILSKVMAKSDEATMSSVINNITDKNKNKKSKLSLKVMADFAEKNPIKLENLTINNEEQIEKLTIYAIGQTTSLGSDAKLITKIIKVCTVDLADIVISEVNKNSINENQSLSAKVLNSIMIADPSKIEEWTDENQNNIITNTIYSAQNQEKGSIEDDTDLSNLVSKIIFNSTDNTGLKVLETLNKTTDNNNTQLSLKILINLSKEKDFEKKLASISEKSTIAEDIVEGMVEDAIQNINNKNDIEDIKDIMKNSDNFLTKIILDIDEKTNSSNKLKIKQIIDEIIKEDPIKSKEIIEDNKEKEIIEEIKKPKKIKEIKDVVDKNISPN